MLRGGGIFCSKRSLFRALLLRVELSAVSMVGKSILFSLVMTCNLDNLVASVICVLLFLMNVTNVNHSPEDKGWGVSQIQKSAHVHTLKSVRAQSLDPGICRLAGHLRKCRRVLE